MLVSNYVSVFVIQIVVLDQRGGFLVLYHSEVLCHHCFDTTVHCIVVYSIKQNLQSCGLQIFIREPSKTFSQRQS